jgi:hypothetical protein
MCTGTWYSVLWYTGLDTNETPCATEYEAHNWGLPGKASGLVRETACYGPIGDPAYAVCQSTHPATMQRYRMEDNGVR